MLHVDLEEAQRRADIIFNLQAPIMDDFCESFVGKIIRVLCCGTDAESGLKTGRSYADSPDIDGQVVFSGTAAEGTMTDVLIQKAEDGILLGEEVCKP